MPTHRPRRTPIRRSFLGSLGNVALLSAAFIFLSACNKAEKEKKSAPPATVATAIQEGALTTIELSKESEARLKLLTGLASVERKPAPRLRTVSGEVVLPPGQTIIVSAPLSGLIAAASTWPIAGQEVKKGDPLCTFTPLLDPAERLRLAEARVDSQRQVESAKVQVEAAKVALERAQQLLRNKVGNQRAVDEAQAALNLANEALETAEARHALLGADDFVEESGALASRTITAPIDGVISKVDAAPDESVPQGAPLFEIGKYDRVWVRTPVYVGRFRDVDLNQPAVVKEFAAPPKEPGRQAPPADAPPAANPAAATVDLFFELENEDHQLQPGQKLAVTLSLRGAQKSLVAPWSAVVYDIHGGAWVYEQVAPRKYARRRVTVRQVDHDQNLAILDSGPEEGAKVVTSGAAELFGTEFGLSK
jgi:RND family efflux transporter MFP subunit